MARLSRHELKKDEFADRMAVVSTFFGHYRKQIVLGGGAALLVVAVAVGVLFYIRGQQSSAAAAFGRALATYHAPVVAEPPAEITIATFKTSEEKYAEAIRQFEEISAQFGSYRQGRWARYYRALAQREMGQFAVAEQELLAIAGESDRDLGAVAKMALAALYQKTSRAEDAERLYRELESNPTAIVPKPAVLIALAELYQRTNPSQATALYQQIERDYPGTAAGDHAARMLRGAVQ